MTNEETIRFIDDFKNSQCSFCKKYKPKNKSFGCLLADALIKKRTPMALQNIKLFVDETGRCKTLDPEGF